MKVMSKQTQKQLLLNHYNDLRGQVVAEVSTEVMQQTVCLLLYSMSLEENHKYSDEELVKIYDDFVALLHLKPGFAFGKSLRSPEIQKYIKDKLNIDLNRIDTKFVQE